MCSQRVCAWAERQKHVSGEHKHTPAHQGCSRRVCLLCCHHRPVACHRVFLLFGNCSRESLHTTCFAADQLYWMLDETASSTAEQLLQQQTEAEAAAALRHLVAGAASCTAPVLSAASQAFLGKSAARATADCSVLYCCARLLQQLCTADCAGQCCTDAFLLCWVQHEKKHATCCLTTWDSKVQQLLFAVQLIMQCLLFLSC